MKGSKFSRSGKPYELEDAKNISGFVRVWVGIGIRVSNEMADHLLSLGLAMQLYSQ
jgi:hypothetical protein